MRTPQNAKIAVSGVLNTPTHVILVSIPCVSRLPGYPVFLNHKKSYTTRRPVQLNPAPPNQPQHAWPLYKNNGFLSSFPCKGRGEGGSEVAIAIEWSDKSRQYHGQYYALRNSNRDLRE
jgi:hypothetical protein